MLATRGSVSVSACPLGVCVYVFMSVLANTDARANSMFRVPSAQKPKILSEVDYATLNNLTGPRQSVMFASVSRTLFALSPQPG